MARKKGKSVLGAYEPESGIGTELRRLLHNITQPVNGIENRSFLVTSAMLSEGKSTVSSLLALTAANHKKMKTVLVDCDLRRPTIHRLFDVPIKEGITDIIEGSIEVQSALKQTEIDNLTIVTAGSIASHPTELFSGEAVKSAIEQIKFYFDFVLVDCAPILPVSDPLLLAPDLDAVLLVVKAGATQREIVKRACTLAERASANIVGIVLNNMNSVLPYFYNHKYYGYNYTAKRH